MIDVIFPTFVYIKDFTGDELLTIQTEIRNVLPKIKQQEHTGLAGRINSSFDFTNSKHTNDVVEFGLHYFKKCVQSAADEYLYSLQYQGDRLNLEGSWVNFFSKDQFYHDHSHPYVKVAGVYFYQTNGVDGKLRFSNPNQHMFFNNFPADGMSEQYITYPPVQGRLMLWPSWLIHRVETNNSDEQRISIGVNFK